MDFKREKSILLDRNKNIDRKINKVMDRLSATRSFSVGRYSLIQPLGQIVIRKICKLIFLLFFLVW